MITPIHKANLQFEFKPVCLLLQMSSLWVKSLIRMLPIIDWVCRFCYRMRFSPDGLNFIGDGHQIKGCPQKAGSAN
jgi:hypothetical protein